MKQYQSDRQPFFLLVILIAAFIGAGTTSGCSQTPGETDTSSNSCGDRVVQKGEKCDTNGVGGDKCPTAETCRLKGGACSTYKLSGTACQAECVLESQVTTCVDGDGCCPTGCQGQDSDCSPIPDACGDGDVKDDEVCDTAIYSPDARSCEKQKEECEAKTTEACRPYRFQGTACHETCKQVANITSCIDDDGCCPAGCKGFDNDCEVSVTDVGKACKHGDNCGEDGFCKVQTHDDNFRGGYCTGDCSKGKCPSGSSCVEVDDRKLCMKNCDQGSDCREPNYQCSNSGGDHRVCTPVRVTCTPSGGECTSNQSCEADSQGTMHCVEKGTGSKGLGDKCSHVAECSGGADARCLPIPRTSTSICTKECDPDDSNACGSGFACVTMQREEKSYCFKTCTDSTTCDTATTGLECRKVGENTKVCTQIYEPVGGPCTKSSECLNNYCLTSGPNKMKDGYCSALCNRNYGCPAGSSCIILNPGRKFEIRQCRAHCKDNNDCREGYKCFDVENLPDKICDREGV